MIQLNQSQLTLNDVNELFALLRENGYEPYFSNGHIQIDKKLEVWS